MIRKIASALVLAAVALSPAAAQEFLGPRLFIERDVHEFGTVKEGQNLVYTFRVFNRGDRNLEIKKVQPD